jgi:hypothetical protein
MPFAVVHVVLLFGASTEPSVAQEQIIVIAPPRVQLGNEAGGNIGILVSGYSYDVGVLANVFGAITANGRYRISGTRTFADHVYLEGEAAVAFALGNAALAQFSFVARAGLAFADWGISLGAWVNITRAPVAVQALPSLSVIWKPSFWGISAGVIERPIGSLARLGVVLWDLTISYSAPIGGDIGYKPQLTQDLALDVHAFGFLLFNAFQSGLTVGLSWRPQ